MILKKQDGQQLRAEGERQHRDWSKGLRVTICHEDHPDADYLTKQNQRAGNQVQTDEKGFLYTMVCKYKTVFGR